MNKNQATMGKFSTPFPPAPHDSAHLHVTGQAIYTDDILEPTGTLQAYLVLSPYAHAKIKNWDLSAVRTAKGVFAVATFEDVPGLNQAGIVVLDEPLLAEKEVHYFGQPIFAIAASDIFLARKAAKKAKIDWEVLPANFDAQKALQEKELLSETMTMRQGEPEKFFSLFNQANQLQFFYQVGGQEHFYLEGQVSLAIPEEDNLWKIYCSTQHPSEVQHLVSRMMGIEDSKVIVETRRLGGGFGGKETQAANFACLAVLLAHLAKKPVKLRLDRDDDMLITGKRHPFFAHLQLAFDPSGKIHALEIELAGNGGFSNDLTNPVVDRAMFHADSAYFIPNRKVVGHRVRTNLQSNTAFRGFGGPQGSYFMEQAMEDLGRHLRKDPLELRLLNCYENGQFTHYGQKIEGVALKQMMEKLALLSDYQKRRKEVENFNQTHTTKKRGLSLTPVKFGISFTLTEYNQAGALIHIYADGSLHLNHGGIEMGQGLFTKVAKIVASVFQIDAFHIRSMPTSTEKIPNTSATAASCGTDLNGMAAFHAATTLKERLVLFLAEKYETSPSNILFSNNQVKIGEKTLPFQEVAKLAKKARVSLSATGHYQTPKIHWDRSKMNGHPFYYYTCGAAVTEAEVDCLTGEYEFLRTDILHDCGRSINPAIDQGQVIGGFIQGLGWLTMEELCWNAEGRLTTHSPSTYKIPTSVDIPKKIHLHWWDQENQAETIFRSKAVGEPPLLYGFSAFLALKNAIYACSDKNEIVTFHAPATPEAVLRAIYQIQNRSWNG